MQITLALRQNASLVSSSKILFKLQKQLLRNTAKMAFCFCPKFLISKLHAKY